MEKQTIKNAKRSFTTLQSRLRKAGLTKKFVDAALLPDWFEGEARKSLDALAEVEIAVARFLGTPIATVRDPLAPLRVPQVQGAQLRRKPGTTVEQLTPAMHASMAIAGAVARNVQPNNRVPQYTPLGDAAEVRTKILEKSGSANAVTFKGLLSYLVLEAGVAVVQADPLPTPKFRGMACMLDGRAVIVNGWRFDHPGCLWNLAHEAGHLACGHVSEGRPTFDEEIEFGGSDDFEREANAWARLVLLGPSLATTFSPSSTDWTVIAREAVSFGRSHSVDAGLMVSFWGQNQGDYKTRANVLKKLHATDKPVAEYLRQIADRLLKPIDEISETDANLLRCVLP